MVANNTCNTFEQSRGTHLSVRMKLNWQNIQEVEIVQQRSAELRNVQILFKTTCLNADYTHTLNSILLHF